MNHTKGSWKISHWENSPGGVTFKESKNGIDYYSGDAVQEIRYDIVSDIKPFEHSIQGSFQGAHIAEIKDFGYFDQGKESLANARLISAAPDLLECIDLVMGSSVLETAERFDLLEKCKEAVKKAKG